VSIIHLFAGDPERREEQMTTEIAVIDLFTGAGGLTQGWYDAARSMEISTRTVASVEIDPEAAATYRENFGTRGQFEGPIEHWLTSGPVPAADVILGGPPCQGFSTLGKRDINDERNFLWRKYAETIVRAQPEYFVLENVVPFLKSVEFEAFQAETLPGRPLQEYVLEPFILSAVDFGSPQNRKRAVVIGRKRDAPSVGLLTPTHYGEERTVRDAFAGISFTPDGIDLPARRTSEGFAGPFRSDELHLGRRYSQLSLDRFAAIPRGGNRFDIPDALLAPCWKSHKSGSADVMGRLHWDRPSVTVRTEFFKPEKGRYLHPQADRAITHYEAARLQGFPDDFRWVGSKVSIAKQIGNAVPVDLARAVSRSILTAISAMRAADPEPDRSEPAA
jgi:DNA (cytosine-5)-methyltransferase 1